METDNRYQPLLYYIVFGSDASELVVSRTKHHVDTIPQGLEIEQLNRQEHGERMDWLLNGTIEKVLRQHDATLYDTCKDTDCWTILHGRIATDGGSDYLRNTIGLVQALIEPADARLAAGKQVVCPLLRKGNRPTDTCSCAEIGQRRWQRMAAYARHD